jgi:ketosteroid isomerase-like protein
MMPSDNLDLVRSICVAHERGDFSSAEWAHPQIEFIWIGGPEEGSWTGVGALAERLGVFINAWESFRATVDEYRELDNERVVVLVHYSGRGKTSGIELGQTQAKGAHLFHVQGGMVTRLVLYSDRDRAFADLGLAPDTGSP